MSLRLYMDHHVPWGVTQGLRHRGVDCLTAQEDGSDRLSDDLLLVRATERGRVLFTQDKDFLAMAAARLRAGTSFTGVVYASQMGVTIGQLIRDLELMAKALQPEEMMNRIEWLPL